MKTTDPDIIPASTTKSAANQEATRLSDLTSAQWKSGIAAWLGWMFDGLDMHLYVLVAGPFVAELLGGVSQKDESVGRYGSLIQAAFLVGWALGGGFFGRVGDRLGRSRTLMLTILTYAIFTGLSFFAQTWWQLFIFRFLAALGIGGEWAAGSSLLAETWPRAWRPWMAAVLQTGVNVGVALAGLAVILLAGFPERSVFLVGVLPAFLVLWIRRAVPEPEEWQTAKLRTGQAVPGVRDLFRGRIRRLTILTLLVCGFALTAHWAFNFWSMQHLRYLADENKLDAADKNRLVGIATWLVMGTSVVGNFVAAWLARRFNAYRKAIALLCVGYCLFMAIGYGVPRGYDGLWVWYALIGVCQGIFALFTMYLPPLFPTLLRTTGAGFCYNMGRIAAAIGTVFFGLFSKVGDYRLALFYASFLFLPAGAIALFLPEPADEKGPAELAD